MKKRICTLALAIVLALSMVIPALAALPKDLPTLTDAQLPSGWTVKQSWHEFQGYPTATIIGPVGVSPYDVPGLMDFLNSNGMGTMAVANSDGSGRYTVLVVYEAPTATTPQNPPSQSGGTQTAPAKPNTPAPSTPAGENTVKVAGQNRTPGQVQKFSNGDYLYTVNSGDTLYDLADRFYGNGNLWKELQKANQKYLNETKDGIIFVGFNLVIPAELGGVRANIG